MSIPTLLPLAAGAPQSAQIVLLETRPVTDTIVARDELPKVKVDPETPMAGALRQWGITAEEIRTHPAGKILNQARWFDQNASQGAFSGLGDRRLETAIATLVGDKPDAAQARFIADVRSYTEAPLEIGASGSIRFNVISETRGAYLFKGAETLFLNEERQKDFRMALEVLLDGGSRLMCVSGVSDARNMPLIRVIQETADAKNVRLIVDAKDESLKEYFANAKKGVGRLAAAKPNLEEFCELVRLTYGDALDARNLNWLLQRGNLADFEAAVLPFARRLADDCMIPEAGHLILTCGPHPFYIVAAKRDEVLRVTPPKIAPSSPIGAGDSTLAMYALFRAFDTPIGPEQALFMSAAGAATAERPASDLGFMQRIFELARDTSANGPKAERV